MKKDQTFLAEKRRRHTVSVLRLASCSKGSQILKHAKAYQNSNKSR